MANLSDVQYTPIADHLSDKPVNEKTTCKGTSLEAVPNGLWLQKLGSSHTPTKFTQLNENPIKSLHIPHRIAFVNQRNM